MSSSSTSHSDAKSSLLRLQFWTLSGDPLPTVPLCDVVTKDEACDVTDVSSNTTVELDLVLVRQKAAQLLETMM